MAAIRSSPQSIQQIQHAFCFAAAAVISRFQALFLAAFTQSAGFVYSICIFTTTSTDIHLTAISLHYHLDTHLILPFCTSPGRYGVVHRTASRRRCTRVPGRVPCMCKTASGGVGLGSGKKKLQAPRHSLYFVPLTLLHLSAVLLVCCRGAEQAYEDSFGYIPSEHGEKKKKSDLL